MKCPNCNQEVEPSAVFCGNCGHQMQQQASAEPVVDGASPPTPPVPSAPVDTGMPQPPVAPMALNPMPSVPNGMAGGAPGPVPGMQPGVPMAPGSQPVPGYAMGQPKPVQGSTQLTLAVVFAVLAIPGALLPIIGLVFGISAIVMAAKHHHAGTGRMVTAIVIGSIGVLLSLAAWAYNVNHELKKRSAFVSPNSYSTATAMLHQSPAMYQTLVTP